MKVLLIYPKTVHNSIPEPSWAPLGLCSIGAVLKREGHIVSIFDRFACQSKYGIGKERINKAMFEHIREFKPDVIGLNTVSPLIYDTLECVEAIRSSYEGIVIAGGHHTTAMPEQTLHKIPGLNGVVQGEGEFSLAKLLKSSDPGSIEGIWWKDGDTIKHTPPNQIDNLDALPFPELNLLDIKFYRKPTIDTIRGHYISSLSMITSRGCTERCSFCAESLTYGKGVRFNSPEYVIEQIKKYIKDYKVEGIYFHDNDFLTSEDRVRKICDMLLSNGLHKKLKWAIQTRVDRINKDILRLMKKSGCIKIELGVEAGSQGQLDGVNKGTSVNMNEEAISLCNKEGISVHAYMMTAFEGEKMADLEERLKWVKKANPSTFFWNPLMIHPGTALYKVKGNNYFENNEWTEENITNYYKNNDLSCITKEERAEWMKENYFPYYKWHNRVNIIKTNSVPKITRIFTNKIKRYFKGRRVAYMRGVK